MGGGGDGVGGAMANRVSRARSRGRPGVRLRSLGGGAKLTDTSYRTRRRLWSVSALCLVMGRWRGRESRVMVRGVGGGAMAGRKR